MIMFSADDEMWSKDARDENIDRIYSFFSRGVSDSGFSISEAADALVTTMTLEEVRDCVDTLLEAHVLYSTIDDEHFKVTQFEI